jgi:hypothetical protein
VGRAALYQSPPVLCPCQDPGLHGNSMFYQPVKRENSDEINVSMLQMVLQSPIFVVVKIQISPNGLYELTK